MVSSSSSSPPPPSVAGAGGIRVTFWTMVKRVGSVEFVSFFLGGEGGWGVEGPTLRLTYRIPEFRDQLDVIQQ